MNSTPYVRKNTILITPLVLWMMVWGGMYSEISQFRISSLVSGLTSFIVTLRPILPLLASVFCLLLLWKGGKIRISLGRGPFFYLSIYGLLGGIFFFLSPEPLISIYWAALFISVIFVAWSLANYYDIELQTQTLLRLNWAIVIVMMFIMFLGPLWPILRGGHNPRMYELPFGLGIQTANGVGRFAGVAGLIALSRIRQENLIKRALWASVLAASIASIMVSESRTAILGFVVGAGVFIIISRKFSWIIIGGPGVLYLLYLSWFQWRFRGSVDNALMMSGREQIWERALNISLRSPFFGFGFHADRFFLEGEHMHMAYFHSLIQSGIIGAVLFAAAMFGIWILLIKNKAFKWIPCTTGVANLFLTECLAILGFMMARSFFESTAAFYGVDLLILVPAFIYLQSWMQKISAVSKNADESNRGTIQKD